jgi:hypothetical protein
MTDTVMGTRLDKWLFHARFIAPEVPPRLPPLQGGSD